MAGPDASITLHCLRCDYNLTGLTRNVCPECGTAFDPVQIRKTLEQRAQSLRRSLLRLYWAPAIILPAIGVVRLEYIFRLYPGIYWVLCVWMLALLASIFVIIGTSISAGMRLADHFTNRYEDQPRTLVNNLLVPVLTLLLMVGQSVLFAAINAVCMPKLNLP